MAPTLTSDRQTFRALVADVAAKAKATLPQAVNGRVEAAAKLVLLQDVAPQADGSILVGSSTDPLKTYRLVGLTCECQDFTRGQAPDGWCQHRIAAGIAKRVGELLATSVPVRPDTVPEPFPDNDPEPAGPAPAPEPNSGGVSVPYTTPPPAGVCTGYALPEAPASCNVYVTISGHKVQVTLRDTDEQRMLERLQVLLDRYPLTLPAPQAASQLSPQQYNAAAMHRKVTDFCPVHNVAMKENHKDSKTWYSHKTPEGWCKGR